MYAPGIDKSRQDKVKLLGKRKQLEQLSVELRKVEYVKRNS